MSVQTRTRDAMPALAPLYAGAAAQAGRDALSRRSRPAELPGLRLVVADHRIDEDALRRWREGVGPVDPDALPSVLVHAQVFGAAMALMADPEFPLPLPGMVHLTNTVTHRRPVAAERPLTVSAEAVGLVPHHAGTAVDLLVQVREADAADDVAPAWEGVSRYLARGVHVSPLRPERPARDEWTAPAPTAQWTLSGGAGRSYARVSGDWNPIHLSGPTAKAFGQRGAIAHGMLLAARMLQSREPAEAGFRWEIGFEAPVVLPARVAVRYAEEAAGATAVTGWDPRRGRRHFTGSIAPIGG